jgi:transcriptional regulator with XRE-family HTH domain
MSSIAQIRAARGLVGWSQRQLARAADLSEPTIKRFETGRGANVSAAAVTKIVAALEAAGVVFIAENGGGPGVRLGRGWSGETIAVEDMNASNDD